MKVTEAEDDLGILSLLHENGDIYFIEDYPRDQGAWVVLSVLNNEDPDEKVFENSDVMDPEVYTFFGINYDLIVAAEWVQYGHAAEGFLK